MENASKALIIAASVLVGIMVLSIGVYLFSIFGDFSSQIEKELSKKEIDEFNARFIKYQSYKDEEGKWQNLCRAQDIVTISNLVKENNKNYEYTNADKNASYYITVNVKNSTKIFNFEQETAEDYINFMKEYSIETGTTNNIFYSCEVEIDPVTELVKKVEFEMQI